MITHDKLYRDIGIRRTEDFVDPKIIDEKEFIFPHNSIVHYFKATPINVGPSKGNGFLSNVKDGNALVFTQIEYINPIGRFSDKTSYARKNIQELKRAAPEFKFILPGKRVSLTKDKLVIHNYGVMNSLYRYSADKMSPYYMWYNTFNTMFENIANMDTTSVRHVYVTLDMPSFIPMIETFKKHTGEATLQTLKLFPTPEHLTLLEVFKFLTPDVFENSPIHRIKVGRLEYVNFILRFNGKMILLNLRNLIESVKEYEVNGKMIQMSYKIMRKLFLYMVMRLQKDATILYGEAQHKDPSMTLENAINAIDNTDSTDNTINEHELDKRVDSEMQSHTVDSEKEIGDMSDEAIEEENIENVIDEEIGVNDNETFLYGRLGYNETEDKASRLRANGLMTKKEYDTTIATLKQQETLKSPYSGDKRKLPELFNVTDEEVTLTKEETELPDLVTVTDKSMLQETIRASDKKYIDETYQKHVVSTIYGLQNDAVLVKSHEVSVEESILGTVEHHTIVIKPLDGAPSKLRVVLPKIEPDGTYMMSGHTYRMRKQRTDAIIRKINSNQVSLTTYYGKSFITRSDIKTSDIGYWFRKNLISKDLNDQGVKNIVMLGNTIMDADLPKEYTMVARYVRSFNYNGVFYNFDYSKRKDSLKNYDLKKVEQGTKYVYITMQGKNAIVMDRNGNIVKYDGKSYTNVSDIYTYFNMDISKAPVEYTTVKVFKTRVPVGVALAYFIGFRHMLKLFKIKHKVYEPRERYERTIYDYEVTFADKKYVFDRRDLLHSIIMGGFMANNKYLKEIPVNMLDSKPRFTTFFNAMEVNSVTVQELNLMENMFIDPMSKKVLERQKEPTTFRGLLYRACEILLDDNYENPNIVYGSVLKGYERIPGLLYTQMVASLRTYKNKSVYSKQQIALDPYSVWKDIGDDSTSLLVDDLNPIIEVKQQEDVTYLGAGGRSRETMVAKTRVFHPSETGIISEASKDSGDIGVSAYMSAVPQLTNTLGTIDKDRGELGVANILSTSALLTPDARKDDPKRQLFITVQNSHTIPIKGMDVPYVRTSYASVFPYRVSEKYAYHAEDDGIVTKLTKNRINVKYKNGTTKSLQLGTWRGKEESGVSYEHTTVTLLKQGSTFKKGDNITHDNAFFTPDIFDPTKVVFLTGTTIRTAMIEEPMTHEDSSKISKKFTDKLTTTVAKVRSFVLDIQDEILNVINIGDKVEPDTLFFTTSIGGIEDGTTLDTKSLDIIQSLKNKSSRAELRGEIVDIKVFYNGEESVMSESFKKFVTECDQRLELALSKPGITGKVNSSYSVNGKPLIPGKAEIKIYVRNTVAMGTGDKAVMGGQLKTTIGDIIDYPVTSEDGQEIEYYFSTRAVAARVVEAIYTTGTTATVLKERGKQIAELYLE